VINHPFCRDIDFIGIAQKKLPPGIVPDLYQANFAREFTEARLSFENETMCTGVESPREGRRCRGFSFFLEERGVRERNTTVMDDVEEGEDVFGKNLESKEHSVRILSLLF
jgi:hypothetical protein